MMNEIMKALKRMKIGKAAGCDRVSSEMLKGGGGLGATLLYYHFYKCCKSRRIPNDWWRAVIVPLYKERESHGSSNVVDLREGRPSAATTEDISAVRLMMETDKRVTYQQIQTSVGIGMSQVHEISHEYLALYSGPREGDGGAAASAIRRDLIKIKALEKTPSSGIALLLPYRVRPISGRAAARGRRRRRIHHGDVIRRRKSLTTKIQQPYLGREDDFPGYIRRKDLLRYFIKNEFRSSSDGYTIDRSTAHENVAVDSQLEGHIIVEKTFQYRKPSLIPVNLHKWSAVQFRTSIEIRTGSHRGPSVCLSIYQEHSSQKRVELSDQN
ncbi:hypothetical protein EVAR_33701_1 [Eumeta japonica]|uniref:Uncharacterized protein n=1 Tax=Eumeta variegata TaxID=151549 RepID=A0A4C1VT77_EUMVA|nr:hypothetical protein EVAR_33701_1 [Eumeta japonica]